MDSDYAITGGGVVALSVACGLLKGGGSAWRDIGNRTQSPGGAGPTREAQRSELAARPFLDAAYPPSPELLRPANEATVCHCEEVAAGISGPLPKSDVPVRTRQRRSAAAAWGPARAAIAD